MAFITDNLWLLILSLVALWYHETRFDLQPSSRNPNQGHEAVQEWLERPHLLYRSL